MSQAQRHARWQSEAMQRGWPAWRRRPLAAVYGVLVLLRQLAFRLGWLKVSRLPVPVLVVGNLVVGGAGKTPTVLSLTEHLRRRGWQPGVISRGHGRRGSGVREVCLQTPVTESGDEPALIRRRSGVPVFVGADRVAAGQALLAAHPDVDLLLCDDGLQHLALHADVSVAVFDERGVGNGWLLPAGLLREPWPPGRWARMPDLVLVQHREDRPPPEVDCPAPVPCFHGRRRLGGSATDTDGRSVPLRDLAAAPFAAVAGLAQPQRFFDMLRAQGCVPERTWALADHAPREAYAPVLAAGLPVVCTEKDRPKLAEVRRAGDPAVWAVALELDIDPAFFDALQARLPAPPSRTGARTGQAAPGSGALSSPHGHQTA
ncbi:MAG: tetraacyldisaccharide 4'-kinase [Burkholderiales bacterium]|nr:MAG: tetraacyldisaccharide 4'-kinase [Burkholderiales bacterium]